MAQGLVEGTQYVRMNPGCRSRPARRSRSSSSSRTAARIARELEPILQGWLEDDAGRRAVPARPGDVPAALGEPGQGLLHARGAGRGSEAVARGVQPRSTARAWRCGTDEDFFDWAATKGLDRKKVEDLYNSFAIVGKINRAKQLAQAYNIQSVPTIIVDGKFVTASERGRRAREHAGAIDELIAKARAERPKS